MSITIDRGQRAVLWTDLVADLIGIGDVYGALAAGEWGKAQELRHRFDEDMRLLDDIGWGGEDPGESFAITVAPDALRRTIERLHADSERLANQQLIDTSLDDSMRSIRTHADLLHQIERATDDDRAGACRPAKPDSRGRPRPRVGSSHSSTEGPPRTSMAPERLLRTTEATLRATDIYSRLLHDRLELARRSGDHGPLGALDGVALLRVQAVAEALRNAAADALAQTDGELAWCAQLVAEAAREAVPPADDAG